MKRAIRTRVPFVPVVFVVYEEGGGAAAIGFGYWDEGPYPVVFGDSEWAALGEFGITWDWPGSQINWPLCMPCDGRFSRLSSDS